MSRDDLRRALGRDLRARQDRAAAAHCRGRGARRHGAQAKGPRAEPGEERRRAARPANLRRRAASDRARNAIVLWPSAWKRNSAEKPRQAEKGHDAPGSMRSRSAAARASGVRSRLKSDAVMLRATIGPSACFAIFRRWFWNRMTGGISANTSPRCVRVTKGRKSSLSDWSSSRSDQASGLVGSRWICAGLNWRNAIVGAGRRAYRRRRTRRGGDDVRQTGRRTLASQSWPAPRGDRRILPLWRRLIGASKARAAVADADVVLFFRAGFAPLSVPVCRPCSRPRPQAAILWVAYPKLTSALAVDLSRDVVHALVEKYGLDTVSQDRDRRGLVPRSGLKRI